LQTVAFSILDDLELFLEVVETFGIVSGGGWNIWKCVGVILNVYGGLG